MSITTPDFANVGSCIAGLVPSVDVGFSFDASQTLACLNQLDINIDLPNIRKLIESIQRLVAALMGDLIPKLQARLDANFFLQIKALASMCKRAGLRARR